MIKKGNYIRINVLNPSIIVTYLSKYFSQFKSLASMHVTLAYDSNRAFECFVNENEIITIYPQEIVGFDKFDDLILLIFKNKKIEAIHKQYSKLGFIWDYPPYQPHITIANVKDQIQKLPLKFNNNLIIQLGFTTLENRLEK